MFFDAHIVRFVRLYNNKHEKHRKGLFYNGISI
ncbi:hypothetical protein BACCAC_02389 [Bacteroides caccae ATCC 43185]|nr:hypothetical protein BACCAC_02389 [Bacteroides caccae ATCC 43185]